jgi:predicted nucleotidyltransferase
MRSKSIILVGSHALGEAQDDSDLDSLVISRDVEHVEQISNSIAILQSASSSIFIDCKVYTEKGFNAAKSGMEHLFLWIALSNGRLLCGEDIREDMKLNPMLITELIWQLIEDLDNSRDLLKAGSHFTESESHTTERIIEVLADDLFKNNVRPRIAVATTLAGLLKKMIELLNITRGFAKQFRNSLHLNIERKVTFEHRLSFPAQIVCDSFSCF